MGNSKKKLEEIEVTAETVKQEIDLVKKINTRLELLEKAVNQPIGYTLFQRNEMIIDIVSLIQIKGIIEFMPNTIIVRDLKLKL